MGNDIDNGKSGKIDKKAKVELEIPDAMKGGDNARLLIQEFRKDDKVSNNNMELSKYVVQEGMQNEDKISFFTEFKDMDDVLRMNTIEAFNQASLLCIRKISKKWMDKILDLNKNIYAEHSRTHKRNMVSLQRKREDAYVKILSSDSSDSGVVPTGIRKFFGVGKK